MFIRLIEEGRRPVYPEGTVVEGRNMTQNIEDTTANDEGLLVDKYKACSLSPIFNGMVKALVDRIEG
jgi:hypothetical protein